MTNTVKCRVKSPKGMWVGPNHIGPEEEIDLSFEQAENWARRGIIYAKGEYAGKLAQEKAIAEASAAEKAAREPTPEKVAPKPQAAKTKGGGSKGS